MSSQTIYRGVFPVVPTTFFDNEELDIESQRRVLDCMIDQGVDGVCILANYSEQFLLSDEERDQLLDVCLDHVAGRIPVIVTCSHYSTRIVIERARRANDKGAVMIMLMPPYHGAALKADETRTYEQLARVAEQIDIPIMIQDAPLSGVSLSVEFLARLAREISNVSYFKIEVPGAANKLRALIEAGGDAVVGPFDGEEAITLMPDLEAGAIGTMSSAMYSELLKPIVQDYGSGDAKAAAAQYHRILSLINYENRQCGLQGTKVVMKEGGVITSDIVRHPLNPMTPASRKGILKLARDLDVLALRWGK
jgi:2-keto-3-deoxy-L-arabinonate dehydratase